MSSVQCRRVLLFLAVCLGCCACFQYEGVTVTFCKDQNDKNCTRKTRNNNKHFLVPADTLLVEKKMFKGHLDVYDVMVTPGELKAIEPGAFSDLKKLKRIFIGGGKLSIIPNGVFTGLPVYYIYIAANTIRYIDSEAFAFMNSLKELYLDKNLLTTFERSWFATKSQVSFLEVLNVHHNKISAIKSGSFHNFPNLRTLDFSFNEIEYIADDIFNDNLNLGDFDLSFNKLTTLSPHILTPIRSVNRFIISFNFIRDLDPSLVDAAKINHISIHPNQWLCPCMKDFEQKLYEKHVQSISSENAVQSQGFTFKYQLPVNTNLVAANLSVCTEIWDKCSDKDIDKDFRKDKPFHDILEKTYTDFNVKCQDECPVGKICRSNYCWALIAEGFYRDNEPNYFVWSFYG